MIPITSDFMLDALCLAAFSQSEESVMILDQVLSLYKESKKKNPNIIDTDLEIIFDIIHDIIHSDINLNKKSEINRIIAKVRKSPLAQKNNSIVENIASILQDSDGISQKRVTSLCSNLSQWITLAKSKQMLADALMKCNKYNPNTPEQNDVLITELLDYAHKLTEIHNNMRGGATSIDIVDMTDFNSVKKAMQAYREKRNANSFKTGLKGLNKMLGKNYGFLPGEFVAFAASSHNYKTGMLLKCARWCVTKSRFKAPEGMIPTVVVISLENETPENSMELIKEAYIDIYKQPVPENANEDELLNKVCEYYKQKHVKLLMYRFDSDFGFSDFVKLQNDLKNRGHFVLASIIDYMTLMKLESNDQDNQPKRIEKLGKQLYDFFKRSNQLGITGVQLDAKADELNASGKTNIVKLYNSFYLADAKALKRVVDILIFLHIESNQHGVPYLTMYWNKHRGETEPTKEDKYCAYRFNPILGILEDEDTDSIMYCNDIFSDDPPDELEMKSLAHKNILDKQREEEDRKEKEEEKEPEEFAFQ